MNWADDEPIDEPVSTKPPAQRYGNAQNDDVYKNEAVYSPRRDRRDRDRDGGRDRDSYHSNQHRNNHRGGERYQEREQHPVPENPPYSAFLGNVPFELQEQDVQEFLGECGAIVDIRISRWRDRAKGCTVQFEEKEGLVQAMAKNGQFMGGRPIRVDVAIERGSRNNSSGWSSGGYNRGGRDRGDRDRGFHTNYNDKRRGDYQDRSSHSHAQAETIPEPDAASLADRPKLTLKPRSVPLGSSDSNAGGSGGGSSNIFGSARPVDSSKKLQEVEAKINQEKEKVKQEVESSTSEASNPQRSADGSSRNTHNETNDGFSTAGGDRRGRRAGGERGGGRGKKNDRGYENFSSQRGRADSSGFVQPKNIQRAAREDKDEESKDKSLETSVNAFSLLDMDGDM